MFVFMCTFVQKSLHFLVSFPFFSLLLIQKSKVSCGKYFSTIDFDNINSVITLKQLAENNSFDKAAN